MTDVLQRCPYAQAQARDAWDALQSTVYRIVDEDGMNIANSQVRHFLGAYWLCVDDMDGFIVLEESAVERLILVEMQ